MIRTAVQRASTVKRRSPLSGKLNSQEKTAQGSGVPGKRQRKARWEEKDRKDAEKRAAKEAKRLERERARKLKALQKLERRAQKERARFEKYVQKEREKALRRAQKLQKQTKK